MAFTIANLQPVGGQAKRGVSPQIWSYATLDAHATVDGAGYFNLATAYGGAYHMMDIGDIVNVVVWATAIGTGGTISTYGTHIIVDKSAGTIDAANVTVGTVTDSD
jgi:hypothetical protein